jgi:hypothetical protein
MNPSPIYGNHQGWKSALLPIPLLGEGGGVRAVYKSIVKPNAFVSCRRGELLQTKSNCILSLNLLYWNQQAGHFARLFLVSRKEELI